MNSNTTAVHSSGPRLLALVCGALPGLFLLLTSTTHLVEGQFVYDVKRLLEVPILFALLLAAAINPALRAAFSGQIGRIPRWVKAVLLAIVLLGVVSALRAATAPMHAMYSLLEVALLSMLVLGVLVIAACRSLAGEVFDRLAVGLLAFTAIAVGIQELLGVAAALQSKLEFFFRISLMHYSWPRFYNQVQSWSLPVLAALPLIWSKSRLDLMRRAWLAGFVCIAGLALHWYIIAMTGGRGVALSLTFALVAGLLVLPASRRLILRWHLPALAAGALLYLGVMALNERVLGQPEAAPAGPAGTAREFKRANPEDWFGKGEDGTRFSEQSLAGRMTWDSSGRMNMWRGSMHDIKSHPWLGNGPMNYACLGPPNRAGHPHNFPLQFAGEWGLPAFLGLLGVLAWCAIALGRSLRNLESEYQARLASMLAIGLLGAGAYSCLSGVLVMPASQVTGVLVGGWLLGLMPDRRTRALCSKKTSWLVLTFAVVLGAATTAFSFHEAAQREYREGLIGPLDQKIPRFWQQGKLCKYLGKL